MALRVMVAAPSGRAISVRTNLQPVLLGVTETHLASIEVTVSQSFSGTTGETPVVPGIGPTGRRRTEKMGWGRRSGVSQAPVTAFWMPHNEPVFFAKKKRPVASASENRSSLSPV